MDTTVTYLNIIDLFMAVVVATIICSGARKGIIVEVFKLFGIFCTIFIALHYYVRFAGVLKGPFFGKEASPEFFAFSVLAILIFVGFILISQGWTLILKIGIHEKVDRYGGIILSSIRSYFTCGLLFFALILSNHKYISLQARQSVSSHVFRYVAVDTYRATYSALIEKFFAKEARNEKSLDLIIGKQEKKKR